MGKKLILLFILFLLNFRNLFSQNTYYITSSGDTVACLMKDREWRQNPISILVHTDNGDKKLTPLATKEVKTNSGEIYRGYSLLLDVSPVKLSNKSGIELARMLNDTIRKFENDSAFLRLLVGGEFSLYELIDWRNKTHFLYSVDGSKPVELRYREVPRSQSYYGVNMENVAGGIYVEVRNEFFFQLDTLSQFNPVLQNIIPTIKYERNSLADFFYLLNKSQVDFLAKKDVTKYQWGFNLEAGANKLNNFFPDGKQYHSPLCPSYSFNIFGTIIPAGSHEKARFTSEIGYHSYGLNMQSIYDSSSNKYTSQPFYRCNYIHGSVLVSYDLSTAKWRPYLGFGFRYGSLTNYKRIAHDSGNEFRMAIDSFGLRHDEEILLSECGLRSKKITISLMYERSNGYDARSGFRTIIDYYLVKVGYIF